MMSRNIFTSHKNGVVGLANGMMPDDGRSAVMIAQHGHQAEQDKNGGIGEESDAALQIAGHDGVQRAVIAA